VAFLNKLRSKPKHIRKIILWITVIVIFLILAAWWLYGSYRKIKNFPKEEFFKEFKEIP